MKGSNRNWQVYKWYNHTEIGRSINGYRIKEIAIIIIRIKIITRIG